NNSPALEWHSAPLGTVKFALIMYDLSVPASEGGPTIHWVLFNIPGSIRSLSAGVRPRSNPPAAVQGANWSGTLGYLGPDPPPGDPAHTYVFTLYALNTELTLRGRVTAGELSRAMGREGGTNHILGRAVLRGTFFEPLPTPPPGQ